MSGRTRVEIYRDAAERLTVTAHEPEGTTFLTGNYESVEAAKAAAEAMWPGAAVTIRPGCLLGIVDPAA